ncbi:MAG TPA: fluoride efflux transporter CrcB [Chitinophagales bacterium]|nr:fluoride efflux transporter CrcB [Chitinophagales bacterium]
MNYILVFVGGGSGSVVRYLLSRYFVHQPGAFPLSTFLSNTISSFILGALVAYMASKPTGNDNLRLFIATGFCGGFSTFSTFSYETFSLLNSGNYKTALLTIFGNLLICYIAIAAGFMLGKNI